MEGIVKDGKLIGLVVRDCRVNYSGYVCHWQKRVVNEQNETLFRWKFSSGPETDGYVAIKAVEKGGRGGVLFGGEVVYDSEKYFPNQPLFDKVYQEHYEEQDKICRQQLIGMGLPADYEPPEEDVS